MLLLFFVGSYAEKTPLDTVGTNEVLDACLDSAYEQMTDLALTWIDRERTIDLYDQELADSYDEEDVKHPLRVLVCYPTDEFDSLYLFKHNEMEHTYINDANIAWWALWNVNMINETGQSHISVRYLSEIMSLIDCMYIQGLQNTCFVCFQLTEDSPCYITVLHPIRDDIVLIYTTAIWVNPGTTMSNDEVIISTLRAKYGPDAFDVIDVTSNYCKTK